MSPPTSLLIDVRTPTEFLTGSLKSDIAPTLNIEYQNIASLTSTYPLTTDITLYCRSGRRSAIALQTLRELGFEKVRDIGGIEEARRMLDREVVGRQIEGELAGVDGEGREGVNGGEGGKGEEKRKREEGWRGLVEGLKGLEGES